MAKGDTTRIFRRRIDDRPARVWTRRAFWYALGFVSALVYSSVGIWIGEHLHRVPR